MFILPLWTIIFVLLALRLFYRLPRGRIVTLFPVHHVHPWFTSSGKKTHFSGYNYLRPLGASVREVSGLFEIAVGNNSCWRALEEWNNTLRIGFDDLTFTDDYTYAYAKALKIATRAERKALGTADLVKEVELKNYKRVAVYEHISLVDKTYYHMALVKNATDIYHTYVVPGPFLSYDRWSGRIILGKRTREEMLKPVTPDTSFDSVDSTDMDGIKVIPLDSEGFSCWKYINVSKMMGEDWWEAIADYSRADSLDEIKAKFKTVAGPNAIGKFTWNSNTRIAFYDDSYQVLEYGHIAFIKATADVYHAYLVIPGVNTEEAVPALPTGLTYRIGATSDQPENEDYIISRLKTQEEVESGEEEEGSEWEDSDTEEEEDYDYRLIDIPSVDNNCWRYLYAIPRLSPAWWVGLRYRQDTENILRDIMDKSIDVEPGPRSIIWDSNYHLAYYENFNNIVVHPHIACVRGTNGIYHTYLVIPRFTSDIQPMPLPDFQAKMTGALVDMAIGNNSCWKVLEVCRFIKTANPRLYSSLLRALPKIPRTLRNKVLQIIRDIAEMWIGADASKETADYTDFPCYTHVNRANGPVIIQTNEHCHVYWGTNSTTEGDLAIHSGSIGTKKKYPEIEANVQCTKFDVSYDPRFNKKPLSHAKVKQTNDYFVKFHHLYFAQYVKPEQCYECRRNKYLDPKCKHKAKYPVDQYSVRTDQDSTFFAYVAMSTDSPRIATKAWLLALDFTDDFQADVNVLFTEMEAQEKISETGLFDLKQLRVELDAHPNRKDFDPDYTLYPLLSDYCQLTIDSEDGDIIISIVRHRFKSIEQDITLVSQSLAKRIYNTTTPSPDQITKVDWLVYMINACAEHTPDEFPGFNLSPKVFTGIMSAVRRSDITVLTLRNNGSLANVIAYTGVGTPAVFMYDKGYKVNTAFFQPTKDLEDYAPSAIQRLPTINNVPVMPMKEKPEELKVADKKFFASNKLPNLPTLVFENDAYHMKMGSSMYTGHLKIKHIARMSYALNSKVEARNAHKVPYPTLLWIDPHPLASYCSVAPFVFALGSYRLQALWLAANAHTSANDTNLAMKILLNHLPALTEELEKRALYMELNKTDNVFVTEVQRAYKELVELLLNDKLPFEDDLNLLYKVLNQVSTGDRFTVSVKAGPLFAHTAVNIAKQEDISETVMEVHMKLLKDLLKTWDLKSHDSTTYTGELFQYLLEQNYLVAPHHLFDLTEMRDFLESIGVTSYTLVDANSKLTWKKGDAKIVLTLEDSNWKVAGMNLGTSKKTEEKLEKLHCEEPLPDLLVPLEKKETKTKLENPEELLMKEIIRCLTTETRPAFGCDGRLYNFKFNYFYGKQTLENVWRLVKLMRYPDGDQKRTIEFLKNRTHFNKRYAAVTKGHAGLRTYTNFYLSYACNQFASTFTEHDTFIDIGTKYDQVAKLVPSNTQIHGYRPPDGHYNEKFWNKLADAVKKAAATPTGAILNTKLDVRVKLFSSPVDGTTKVEKNGSFILASDVFYYPGVREFITKALITKEAKEAWIIYQAYEVPQMDTGYTAQYYDREGSFKVYPIGLDWFVASNPESNDSNYVHPIGLFRPNDSGSKVIAGITYHIIHKVPTSNSSACMLIRATANKPADCIGISEDEAVVTVRTAMREYLDATPSLVIRITSAKLTETEMATYYKELHTLTALVVRDAKQYPINPDSLSTIAIEEVEAARRRLAMISEQKELQDIVNEAGIKWIVPKSWLKSNIVRHTDYLSIKNLVLAIRRCDDDYMYKRESKWVKFNSRNVEWQSYLFAFCIIMTAFAYWDFLFLYIILGDLYLMTIAIYLSEVRVRNFCASHIVSTTLLRFMQWLIAYQSMDRYPSFTATSVWLMGLIQFILFVIAMAVPIVASKVQWYKIPGSKRRVYEKLNKLFKALSESKALSKKIRNLELNLENDDMILLLNLKPTVLVPVYVPLHVAGGVIGGVLSTWIGRRLTLVLLFGKIYLSCILANAPIDFLITIVHPIAVLDLLLFGLISNEKKMHWKIICSIRKIVLHALRVFLIPVMIISGFYFYSMMLSKPPLVEPEIRFNSFEDYDITDSDNYLTLIAPHIMYYLTTFKDFVDPIKRMRSAHGIHATVEELHVWSKQDLITFSFDGTTYTDEFGNLRLNADFSTDKDRYLLTAIDYGVGRYKKAAKVSAAYSYEQKPYLAAIGTTTLLRATLGPKLGTTLAQKFARIIIADLDERLKFVDTRHDALLYAADGCLKHKDQFGKNFVDCEKLESLVYGAVTRGKFMKKASIQTIQNFLENASSIVPIAEGFDIFAWMFVPGVTLVLLLSWLAGVPVWLIKVYAMTFILDDYIVKYLAVTANNGSFQRANYAIFNSMILVAAVVNKVWRKCRTTEIVFKEYAQDKKRPMLSPKVQFKECYNRYGKIITLAELRTELQQSHESKRIAEVFNPGFELDPNQRPCMVIPSELTLLDTVIHRHGGHLVAPSPTILENYHKFLDTWVTKHINKLNGTQDPNPLTFEEYVSHFPGQKQAMYKLAYKEFLETNRLNTTLTGELKTNEALFVRENEVRGRVIWSPSYAYRAVIGYLVDSVMRRTKLILSSFCHGLNFEQTAKKVANKAKRFKRPVTTNVDGSAHDSTQLDAWLAAVDTRILVSQVNTFGDLAGWDMSQRAEIIKVLQERSAKFRLNYMRSKSRQPFLKG